MPQYHGLEVAIPENDRPHIEYFEQAASGTLHLQSCADCDLMRYPPGPMCPECGGTDLAWSPISGKGTIHSYYYVPHAVNPAFRDWTPYPVILVEIDEQRGQPTADRSVRIIANCIDADGGPELEANVAIGKRVEVTMIDMGDGMALPQFRLSDEDPEHEVWQFPENA